MRRALISVFNKTGVVDLGRQLYKAGWEIISSGGTQRALQEAGVPTIPIEQVTGNPEAFGGRMKTISFQVASALLYDRGNSSHVRQAEELGIVPIDLVVCNFYPFHTYVHPGTTDREAVELIDIGGPCMVRAAAKNFLGGVAVVVDPDDYPLLYPHISGGEIPENIRRRLARKAFQYTAAYERAIAGFWEKGKEGEQAPPFRIEARNGQALRYGENPHQQGWVYWDNAPDPLSLSSFQKLQGKELSYNNLLDSDGALYALSQLGGKRPACVVVKHTNPCGAAVRDTLEEAYRAAWHGGDSLAAFGGIIAVNRPVSRRIAEQMAAFFFEVLLAPAVDNDALDMLAAKKNVRVLVNPALEKPFIPSSRWVHQIRGGWLMQDADTRTIGEKDCTVATQRPPTAEEMRDLLFAWNMARASKSNTIVAAKDETLIASGVGQQDRKRCCELCVAKGGERLRGAVAASDAFFPFRDGPDVLLRAGITAIIQPGGSIRDQETIDACNEAGAAMVFTGARCFRH